MREKSDNIYTTQWEKSPNGF